MAKINDSYDIGAAFSAIEDELMASMIHNMRRHKVEEIKEDKQWSMWQAEQLKSLAQYKKVNRKKYGKQFRDINGKIGELIQIAKTEGEMSQEIAILNAIKKGFPAKKVSPGAAAEFFKLNDRKLNALINATTNDIQKAETAVLRMANDQYRKVIYNAQVYANTGAGTYEKAVDMATKDFLSAGLNCVQYANGARHTLADYADMAIRTASKRAYLQGEGQKRQEWGISTVIINKRGNPCPKCLPWVGKILIDDVWSGGSRKDGKYPLMSTAIAAGLYHPRCKDSHTTYFDGISTPPDDKFTRTELEEIEEQNKQEAQQQYIERQKERADRLSKYLIDQEDRRINQEKSLAWSEKRDTNLMDQAIDFSDRSEADSYHRPKTESIWKSLSEHEKKALWRYTGSNYIEINKALREGAAPTKEIQKYIDDLTSALEKSRLEDDIWVRRGVSINGLSGLLKVDASSLNDKSVLDTLVNKVCEEKGFLSTGVANDAGFSGIDLKICLPKGTRAIYAEPFSSYGGTNSNGTWDGIQKASYVGSEAELIVQRGSKMKIKEVKTNSDGQISEIVLLLIGQSH